MPSPSNPIISRDDITNHISNDKLENH